MLILSRTLTSGAKAGLMMPLGTQAGNLVHAVLAGAGVSTALLLFPSAFTVLKPVGVACLNCLAVLAWRGSSTLDPDRGLSDRGKARRWFLLGLANNLANPKVIAFFLALFPQFIARGAGGACAARASGRA